MMMDELMMVDVLEWIAEDEKKADEVYWSEEEDWCY